MNTKIDYFKTRTEFVLSALESKQPKQVMDVGFIGVYDEPVVHYSIVESLSEDDSLVGLDIDKKSLDLFIKKTKTQTLIQTHNLEYLQGDVLDLKLGTRKFSHVLMLEVFEHLKTPYVSIDQVKKVLKKKGKLIITYPNPMSLQKVYQHARIGSRVTPQNLVNYRGAHDHRVFPHPVGFINYLGFEGFDVKRLSFMKVPRFTGNVSVDEAIAKVLPLRMFSYYAGIEAVLK